MVTAVTVHVHVMRLESQSHFLFCLSSVIPVNSRIPGTLDSPGKSGMTGMTGIPVIPGAGPALKRHYAQFYKKNISPNFTGGTLLILHITHCLATRDNNSMAYKYTTVTAVCEFWL